MIIDSTSSGLRLFDMTVPEDVGALAELRASGTVLRELDVLPALIDELFSIEFPFVPPGTSVYEKTLRRYLDNRWNGGSVDRLGVWAYYPWQQCAVHLPSEREFLLLRTARNRFLITPEEQDVFYTSRVGVGGLSVGLSAVTSLVLSGGAGQVRIADHDTLGLTNLNRLLGSVCQLGSPKTEICLQRVLELNPFQTVLAFDGLTDATVDQFLGDGDEKLDLFIEEIDDIRMKAVSRFAARTRRIPVIMATDNGDNAIIDIERFDLEPDRQLFHGFVPENELRAIPSNPSLAERVKLASAIVGPDITPRTQLSLQEVGARLPAWPQLGTAATLSGVLCAYVARRILTGQTMPSGRYFVSLDSLLDVDYPSPGATAERARIKSEFVNNLSAMFGVTL